MRPNREDGNDTGNSIALSFIRNLSTTLNGGIQLKRDRINKSLDIILSAVTLHLVNRMLDTFRYSRLSISKRQKLELIIHNDIRKWYQNS